LHRRGAKVAADRVDCSDVWLRVRQLFEDVSGSRLSQGIDAGKTFCATAEGLFSKIKSE
jgi:hypothetical protein